MKGDTLDPRGLIKEAYRMDGITAEECRTIFLDWALGQPLDQDTKAIVQQVLTQYADQPADHPMTQTLVAALRDAGPARRRGGRAGRLKA